MRKTCAIDTLISFFTKYSLCPKIHLCLCLELIFGLTESRNGMLSPPHYFVDLDICKKLYCERFVTKVWHFVFIIMVKHWNASVIVAKCWKLGSCHQNLSDFSIRLLPSIDSIWKQYQREPSTRESSVLVFLLKRLSSRRLPQSDSSNDRLLRCRWGWKLRHHGSYRDAVCQLHLCWG